MGGDTGPVRLGKDAGALPFQDLFGSLAASYVFAQESLQCVMVVYVLRNRQKYLSLIIFRSIISPSRYRGRFWLWYHSRCDTENACLANFLQCEKSSNSVTN